MGDVTIHTDYTQIYWPSDWLVDGAGTTFKAMECPEYEVDEDCDGHSILSLVFDWDIKKWYVISGLHGADTECRRGTVVMETADYRDAATYLSQYMVKVGQWLAEQEEKA